jgi:hypothetical protein
MILCTAFVILMMVRYSLCRTRAVLLLYTNLSTLTLDRDGTNANPLAP